MKLYYSPGACSLSPHIVAAEANLPVEIVKVDFATKKTEKGDDYLAINPKGYVPALELDSGEVLTEGPAIVQYLADQKPESKLAPANGTIARYHLMEALGYINSEIHKTYSPLFSKTTHPDTRAERAEYLKRRYGQIEKQLAKSPYLMGEDFSVADAYLFTVTRWARAVKVDLTDMPNIQAFQERVAARPGVQQALREEGLLKS